MASTSPSRQGPKGGQALRVAVDATPLIGHRTGVGEFCRGALGGLAGRTDVAVSAFAVSWRRRQRLGEALPAGVPSAQRAMPARPLQWSWRRFGRPSAEWFVGERDVVHGTNFVVPPTRRAGRVVTVHDLTAVRFPEMCDRPTLAYPELIRRAVRAGAFVHTPSMFVAAEVIESFGADPDRVRAVHSGIPERAEVDRERAKQAVADLLPDGTGRVIVSLATAEPRKDLPGLVAAFDELAVDRPDVTLVLAGPVGWGEHELSRAIGASPHAGRIVRAGWVDDTTVAGLIDAATVLAYPSRYEGFGFPPLEAMAKGVPVVSTRAGAIPEVLGSGAALVPVGDVAALAGALAEVLDSEARAQELSIAGRQRAAEFSWARCADGLAALYRDVVADRSRAGSGG
jgi:glycosyltransferase involved in cell wall biosynthesis